MVDQYLLDRNFLKLMDLEPRKIQFTRIEILHFVTEQPIAQIEGISTGGSLNLNGNSSMRRTMNLSVLVDPRGLDISKRDSNIFSSRQSYGRITEVQNLISINKKIRVYTGFLNTLANRGLGYYPEEEIIWYPLGTYIVKSASVTENEKGISISLTLNDKTAQLNGDVGGVIPAATIFSEQEVYSITGERVKKPVLLKEVIKNLVVEFGGESPENVFILDIPDTILKVVKWSGSSNVELVTIGAEKYFRIEVDTPENGTNTTEDETGVPENETDTIEDETSTTEDEAGTTESETDTSEDETGTTESETVRGYKYGEDIGYVNEPFVYPGVLECNAGDSVSSVLDKIKNTLGNFEWFYDVHGHFIFQEIKNYLNVSKSTEILKEKNYLSLMNLQGDSQVYSFDTLSQVKTVSSSPQYNNIKNDFIVWGTKKTANGNTKAIRFHLAFANKPSVDSSKKRLALVYNNEAGIQQAIILTDKNFEIITDSKYNVSELDKTKYYLYNDKIFYWNENSYQLESIYTYPSEEQQNEEQQDEEQQNKKQQKFDLVWLTTDDWRTELLYLGLEAENIDYADSPYYAELKAEWTKIYNLTKEKSNNTYPLEINGSGSLNLPLYRGGYRGEIGRQDYDYWLDFISGDEGGRANTSQFSIDNIGRRTKIVVEDSVNCVFPPETNSGLILIEANETAPEKREECIRNGQDWIQVSEDLFNNLSIGGGQNSAYDKVVELITTHTQYNESITLTTLPVYYLEPNSRILIQDQAIGVNGYYLISSISLPLAIGGTSNITATKCLTRELITSLVPMWTVTVEDGFRVAVVEEGGYTIEEIGEGDNKTPVLVVKMKEVEE